jgi:hypothetical protein
MEVFLKPSNLNIVEIPPVNIGDFVISKLEIDLRHVNYGLDPKARDFRKRARSELTAEDVIRLFQLLDGNILNSTTISNGYAYFASEVYPTWLKHWFKLIFCF